MLVRDSEILYNQIDALQGHDEFLKKVRPVVVALVLELVNLPQENFGKGALPVFEKCVLRVNKFGEYIETVERESLMEVLYNIGELVGMSRELEFLEEWRGDW